MWAELRRRLATRAVLVVAAAKLALHLVTLPGYGIFRDELYYIACAKHLAWGYVDHPPLVAFVAAFSRTVGGDALTVLRLPAALTGALTVMLTGWLTCEAGASRYAQALAASAVALSPFFLAVHHIYSMNALETPIWCAMAVTLVRVDNGEASASDWVRFGVLGGLGLLNKYTTIFFVLSALIALLASRRRSVLASRWPWFAAALGLVVVAPNLLWQFSNGWPTLEFMANARASKHASYALADFIKEQALLMGPLCAILGGAGIAGALGDRRGTRLIVGTSVVLSLLLLLARGKPYYLGPVFPLLFAAGAITMERCLRRPMARAAVLLGVLAAGLALSPMTLPVLPIECLSRYVAALGMSPSSGERHERGVLPQLYADMFGWRELAGEVGRVYQGLSERERAAVAVLADNYGQAGALDYFGPSWGLPRAASGHNGYYLWGPPEHRGDLAIIVGGGRQKYETIYEEVIQVAEIDHPFAMPYERHVPVYLCRRPRMALREAWTMLKHFR